MTFSWETSAMHDEFFRWRAVNGVTQLSRSTIWRLEREGQFPNRRKLSGNTVGWLRSEVEAWVATRTRALPAKVAKPGRKGSS